jgi:hypothetical protein
VAGHLRDRHLTLKEGGINMKQNREIDWSRARFAWKKNINSRRDLTRGAKLFASHLCDACVNRHTGLIPHRTGTLASGMGVCERTIQRGLKELVEAGYLEKVPVDGLKRVFRIVPIPKAASPKKSDKIQGNNPTQMSRKGDKSVAPHNIYQESYQESPPPQASYPSVTVRCDEQYLLEEWAKWIKETYDIDGVSTLSNCKNGSHYVLPSRHPPDHEKDRLSCLTFFGEIYGLKLVDT